MKPENCLHKWSSLEALAGGRWRRWCLLCHTFEPDHPADERSNGADDD